MDLKKAKVQVFFTEDSIPRIVNAELTAKGIENLEHEIDGFTVGFTKWLVENNYHDSCILGGDIIKELLEIYKKEIGL